MRLIAVLPVLLLLLVQITVFADVPATKQIVPDMVLYPNEDRTMLVNVCEWEETMKFIKVGSHIIPTGWGWMGNGSDQITPYNWFLIVYDSKVIIFHATTNGWTGVPYPTAVKVDFRYPDKDAWVLLELQQQGKFPMSEYSQTETDEQYKFREETQKKDLEKITLWIDIIKDSEKNSPNPEKTAEFWDWKMERNWQEFDSIMKQRGWK